MDLTRRHFVKGVGILTAGICLGGRRILAAERSSLPPAAASSRKAAAVIEVWLSGGPSHLETFDPKPEAGDDYNGGFKAIPTNVPGVQISEFLPLLARQAEKYTIIRSLTHGVNGHETATYWMQTGREPGGKVFPAIGAVIGMMKGYEYGYTGKVPPYIVVPASKGRFSEMGFLSPKYRPLITGGDPNAPVFAVEGIVNQTLSKEQQGKNRTFLEKIDAMETAFTGHPELTRFDSAGKEAYELITGAAGEVFNLGLEPKEIRERYGRSTFGQACLAARRLVEAGVPYVTINATGWDTHKRHFQAMRQKAGQLDQGLAALLQDLSDRKLLDRTLVWCSGEFGRQPKISQESPWNGGRQHHGKCFSALVAGGGFKGGCVVGASDEKGENPVLRPVFPQDFLGSIYELAGIDPDAKLPNPMGEDIRIMPPPSANGRLKEIYA